MTKLEYSFEVPEKRLSTITHQKLVQHTKKKTTLTKMKDINQLTKERQMVNKELYAFIHSSNKLQILWRHQVHSSVLAKKTKSLPIREDNLIIKEMPINLYSHNSQGFKGQIHSCSGLRRMPGNKHLHTSVTQFKMVHNFAAI